MRQAVLGQHELDHVVDGDDGGHGDQRRREVRAVQQVHVLARGRLHQADLLPPHLLDVFAEAGQPGPDFDVAESVGERCGKRGAYARRKRGLSMTYSLRLS